jgi:hypothetical protein
VVFSQQDSGRVAGAPAAAAADTTTKHCIQRDF